MRAAFLAFFATFAGCYLLYTLPDLVASMLGRSMPIWFYESQASSPAGAAAQHAAPALSQSPVASHAGLQRSVPPWIRESQGSAVCWMRAGRQGQRQPRHQGRRAPRWLAPKQRLPPRSPQMPGQLGHRSVAYLPSPLPLLLQNMLLAIGTCTFNYVITAFYR